ncbi:MAG: Integrase core domain protein [Syntrophorhabdus sp. PtaU1.Bin002]|nr:MAG: Integrase core domain protein [Syntrophorhabdus sp. PtaU1.Bin002]
MENSSSKPRRRFTPEQKYEIIRDIEYYPTIREGLVKHGINSGLFYKWKRQLAVGINASLRNTKPLKSPDLKKLEEENRKLKEVTLSQSLTLAPYEKEAIEKTKEEYPHLRRRQIQGILQNKGISHHHLKSLNLVEPYERRPSPLKEPRYTIWRKNLMWGCDWSKLRINYTRWYLLIIIDFFSRYLVAWDICPSVNSSPITRIYKAGLKSEGIKKGVKPELRVDRGSSNTSLITQEFFTLMGADLSFARVRRPTDNAPTERFFGTAKQEEIYVVGNYPDKRSAREEIGKYRDFYNNERPHQSLWNFTPALVHEMNNNTVLLEKLTQLKYEAKMKRRFYWEGKRI